MGAAPVLIMLAAVGVDYGWQPAGTTSQRGDNIEYIVQISPDQLQQLRSIGEITSTVDPSIQGRVSRIVVTVGTGPLPKDAGRVAISEASTTKESQSRVARNASQGAKHPPGIGDNEVVPIPEIRDELAVRSIAGNPLSDQQVKDVNASVMKPDPQGAGFQMPESQPAAAQSALDQLRNRTVDAANQFGSQTRAALDAQANALTQAAGDAAGRAANQLQNGLQSLTVPNSGRPGAAASADPMTGRENQWTTGAPSTAPVDPNARTAPWSGAEFVGPIQPVDPRATANPALTNPYSNPGNSFSGNVPSSAPTRDPSDPKWSGYGSSNQFGSLPGGANGLPAGYAGPTAATIDPGAATTAPSLPVGYTRDAQGNIYDSLGRTVDRSLRPVDFPPAGTSNIASQSDRYGNPIDSQGRPVSDYTRQTPDPRYPSTAAPPTTTSVPAYGAAVPAYTQSQSNQPAANQTVTAADRFGTASPYDPGSYSTPTFAQSQLGSNAATLQQQRTEQELAATREQLRNYQQRESSTARTRLIPFEDEASSASDQRSAATVRARMELDRVPPVSTRPRSVSAQAFFNFVLLISVVGNAYLIFETNNLRRKFRNMISSVRSSKVTAQPAT